MASVSTKMDEPVSSLPQTSEPPAPQSGSTSAEQTTKETKKRRVCSRCATSEGCCDPRSTGVRMKNDNSNYQRYKWLILIVLCGMFISSVQNLKNVLDQHQSLQQSNTTTKSITSVIVDPSLASSLPNEDPGMPPTSFTMVATGGTDTTDETQEKNSKYVLTPTNADTDDSRMTECQHEMDEMDNEKNEDQLLCVLG